MKSTDEGLKTCEDLSKDLEEEEGDGRCRRQGDEGRMKVKSKDNGCKMLRGVKWSRRRRDMIEGVERKGRERIMEVKSEDDRPKTWKYFKWSLRPRNNCSWKNECRRLWRQIKRTTCRKGRKEGRM